MNRTSSKETRLGVLMSTEVQNLKIVQVGFKFMDPLSENTLLQTKLDTIYDLVRGVLNHQFLD